MRVLVVAGDVYLLRALLSAFRRKGILAWGSTRGDWSLHASKIHSAAPFDVAVVGSEFASGSKREPAETAAEFVARLRKRDPLCSCMCLVPDESAPVPFGAIRIVGAPPVIRRVVRAVERMGPRQGALPL